MKKQLSLLLAAFIVVASFAGCSKKPADSNSDTSVGNTLTGSSTDDSSSDSTDESSDQSNTSSGGNSSNSTGGSTGSGGSTAKPKTDPLKANLNGQTIEIITPNVNGIFNTKKNLSAYQNACAERIATLQSKINCKIKITVKTVDEIAEMAFTTIASGSKFADIIEVPIYGTSAHISQKSVIDLRSISTLDLSKSYMNAGDAVNSSTFYNKSYFLATTDMIADSGMGYFFNKRLIKETGLENPYDLVKNNKWTISKLREMAKKATKDKDGKAGMSKNDQWGIIQTSYVADGAATVLAACNAEMIKPDGKGGAVYNTDSKEVLDAISLATDIFVKDGDCYAASDGDKELWNMFITGKGLFLGAGINIAQKIMDMDDDYGFVPFPRSDNASSLKIGTNWNSSVLMVPSNPKAKDYNNVGYFLQAFCKLSENTTKTKYDEYSDRYFRDDESGKMMETMAKSQKVTTSSILGSTGDWGIHEGTYKILYNCVPGKVSPVTEIQKYKPFSTANLADLMYKLKTAK